MDELKYVDYKQYHCFIPSELPEGSVDDVYMFIEKKLMHEQKDVVINLEYIESIFSQHLTMFLKVYKLLESFKLSFVIVGMSPAVLNVIQMTQLDGYLKLYMTREEYEESLGVTSHSVKAMSFSCEILKGSEGAQIVEFEGFVSHTPQLDSCLSKLEGENVIFDFQKVGFIDAGALIALTSIKDRHKLFIKNPSKAIVELLEEKDVLDLFLIEE